MSDNKSLLDELKALLSTRIRGIKKVTEEYGIICVYVSSHRAARTVTLDLLRAGVFRSVSASADNLAGKGFVVYAARYKIAT